MATLYIAEFENAAEVVPSHGASPVALQPPLAEQTVAIGAETDSAPFNALTKIVRLHADTACSILFGTAPTATTAKMRMAAGQTEYFAVPVNGAYKVSVIANAT